MLETYGKAEANGVTKMRVEIYNQDLNKWVGKKDTKHNISKRVECSKNRMGSKWCLE